MKKIILIITVIITIYSITKLSYLYYLTHHKRKYIKLVNDYHKKGRFYDAIAVYKKLLNYKLDNHQKAIIHTNIGYLYYKLNLLNYTEQHFKKVISYHPKLEYYHNLMILLYEQDRLPEAEEVCNKILKTKVDKKLKEDIELIKLENELSTTLKLLKKNNYIIKYQNDIDDVFPYYILKIIEKVDNEITPIFYFFNKGKVIIKIFDEFNFNKLLNVINKKDVLALCINNKLIIKKPTFFPYNKEMKEVVAHEYIHLILHRICPKNLPTFLDEGIAQFFSKEIIDVKVDKFIPLKELKWDGEEVEISYKESLSFVSYLIEKYGFDKFSKLIFYLYVDEKFNTAVNLTYKKEFKELEKEWRITSTSRVEE